MYQNFIGIDIGKKQFYASLYSDDQVKIYDNSLSGFNDFSQDFDQHLANGLVVLETTGGYEIELIHYLQQLGNNVHRANTRKVKSFIRSFGQLGKSDAIDAKALAKYGAERHATLEIYIEPPFKKLVKLVQRRSDLKQMLVQEKNRLKSPDQAGLGQSFKKIIGTLEEEIDHIDKEIDTVFVAHPQLQEISTVLKSVAGVGNIVAKQLCALLPELGHVNRKQIASISGVAPHPNESGARSGHRFVRGGRPEVKRVLFMAAMAASKSHSELGDFYRRLVAEGKKKMVALTALMRKIVVIANARVRDYLIENNITQHS